MEWRRRNLLLVGKFRTCLFRDAVSCNKSSHVPLCTERTLFLLMSCSDHTDDAEQLQSLNEALENKAQKIEETKLRLKVTTQRAGSNCTPSFPIAVWAVRARLTGV